MYSGCNARGWWTTHTPNRAHHICKHLACIHSVCGISRRDCGSLQSRVQPYCQWPDHCCPIHADCRSAVGGYSRDGGPIFPSMARRSRRKQGAARIRSGRNQEVFLSTTISPDPLRIQTLPPSLHTSDFVLENILNCFGMLWSSKCYSL